MARPAPLRRLVVLAVAAWILAGCSTAGEASPGLGSPSGDVAPTNSPSPSTPSTPTTSTSPTPSESPSAGPSPNADRTAVAQAAADFMASDSATFTLVIKRFKPGTPDEVSAAASGVVDPAADRGRMRYELFPNDPDGSPFALGPFDIAWDATDYWTSAGPDDLDPAWQHTTRAAAPGMALIGRVNEEPLALVRFAAAAEPGRRRSATACPARRQDRRALARPGRGGGRERRLRATRDLSRVQPGIRTT